MKRMRAVGIAVVAVGLSCTSNVPLEAGNAYRCDFNEGPTRRDLACPDGWVCGADHRCREFNPDELFPREGKAYPDFDASVAERLYPSQPREPVKALFLESLAGSTQVGIATLAPEARTLTRLNPSCLRREPPHPLPAEVIDPTAMLRFALPPGWPFPELRFYVNGNGRAVAEGTPGVFHRLSVMPVENVRRLIYFYPKLEGDSLRQMALLTWASGEQLEIGQVDVEGLASMPRAVFTAYAGVNKRQPRDARVWFKSEGAVPLVLTADRVLAPCDDETVAGCELDPESGERWRTLFLAALSGGENPWVAKRLGSSSDQESWAVVLERGDPAHPASQQQSVGTWRVGTETIRSTISPCVPCGRGETLVRAVPFTSSGGGVDVLCELGSGLRKLHRVVGSTAGRCELRAVQPLFDPRKITAFDDSTPLIVFGTEDGNVWLGQSLADAQPLFLERAATAVTLHQGRLLALTPDYLALEVPGFGMVTIDPDNARPAAIVGGRSSAFVFPGGQLVEIQRAPAPPDGTACAPSTSEDALEVTYGPRLLDPRGAAAPGPYLAQAVEHPGEGRYSLAATAGDSLYFTPELKMDFSHLELTEGLIAQVTPEPNFPIRSLAVDRSFANDPSDPRELHGYLVTSRRLFEFTLPKQTRRWELSEIHLIGGEPVGVDMLLDDSVHGRVVYRDGSVYTLPSGFPLLPSLIEEDGSSRITSWVNAEGLPIALGRHGVYVGTPSATEPDPGRGERYLLWTWNKSALPEEQPDFEHGTLAILRDPSAGEEPAPTVVYFFDQAGGVFRLGQVRPAR